MRAELVVRLLDARVPLAPGRAPQLLGRPAMPGELAAVDRVAGAGEPLGDEAQLDRRAAEAVDQQHPDPPVLEEQAAIR